MIQIHMQHPTKERNVVTEVLDGSGNAQLTCLCYKQTVGYPAVTILMAMGASTAGGPSKRGLSTVQKSNRNQASKRRTVTTQFLKENSEAALKRIDRNNWVEKQQSVLLKGQLLFPISSLYFGSSSARVEPEKGVVLSPCLRDLLAGTDVRWSFASRQRPPRHPEP